MTTILVCGFFCVVALSAGFFIGWFIGHEEGMEDMEREISLRRNR